MLFIILPLTIFAQEKLSKLQMPTSPASSILGLQPSVVLSPKSYQSLETALYSNFINSSGNALIPNDFALEFTPYWTKMHQLSIQEYLYPKSGYEQIMRNSSFSIASTQKFQLGDSSATNSLSFGYRTTLYFGNKKDRSTVNKFSTELRNNQKIQSKLSAIAEDLIENKKVGNQEEFMRGIRASLLKIIYESGKFDKLDEVEELTNSIIKESALIPSLNLITPDVFIDSLYSLIDTKLSSEILYNEYKEYLKERFGLSIDFAYAALLNFPSNTFETSYIPNQAFWITPTYRFEDKLSFLKAMLVIRYEWYNTEYYKKYFPNIKIYENNVDIGGSFSTEFKKYLLSFEMVGRSSKSIIPAGLDSEGNELYRKEQKSDFQYIGSFSYYLNDQVVLSYSLGNRFQPVLNFKNTLASILTLSFGFGSPTKNDIDFNR
jgi:hypothetical protein